MKETQKDSLTQCKTVANEPGRKPREEMSMNLTGTPDPTSGIQLALVNRSSESDDSEYVIINDYISSGNRIAWTVVKNLGIGDTHPFLFPTRFAVSASDSDGNNTPALAATAGNAFEMIRTPSGDELVLASTPASSPNVFEVRNKLPQGAIRASVYASGKLQSIKTDVLPGEKADFEFSVGPSISIGAATGIVEGQVLSPDTVGKLNTRIGLLGIKSADIVVSGGGAGAKASPFVFTLENVVKE